jgi:cyclophilin family peptidyl-prolyl cis-trans isomerase
LKRIALLLAVVLLVGCSAGETGSASCSGAGGKPVSKQYSQPPAMSIDPNKTYQATLSTSMGDIKVQLLAKDAPMAVNNFVFLAREKFYDCVKFHRVIKGFMIQGGDPTGTGRGGPGYRFNDELANAPRGGYKKGTLAMANAGPNTNGSQFFIMDADYPLPPQYVAFGQVTEGQDIVAKIASVPAGGPERSTPNEDVLINSVTIEER